MTYQRLLTRTESDRVHQTLVDIVHRHPTHLDTNVFLHRQRGDYPALGLIEQDHGIDPTLLGYCLDTLHQRANLLSEGAVYVCPGVLDELRRYKDRFAVELRARERKRHRRRFDPSEHIASAYLGKLRNLLGELRSHVWNGSASRGLVDKLHRRYRQLLREGHIYVPKASPVDIEVVATALGSAIHKRDSDVALVSFDGDVESLVRQGVPPLFGNGSSLNYDTRAPTVHFSNAVDPVQEHAA